jgi:hypothetical protein
MALRAWVCVEALTRSFTARCDRKALSSGLPVSAGCRTSWKKMYRRIQCTYACRLALAGWTARVAFRLESATPMPLVVQRVRSGYRRRPFPRIASTLGEPDPRDAM